ncbi:fumarylacetoacetate hydrolase family protein [Amphibacillus cookii]|uniref:fumarylacetoacetate hydrolase family protein n=1 Tax=Amphibacillus cookii TaxID=767787 RepID=UPI00195E8597|nr:fumarylacetoacetate hydrolase family protein [Amphibacillus cookii]MBM7540956.1 acylpyruvate hydrolase [Amphibacillus cookii]
MKIVTYKLKDSAQGYRTGFINDDQVVDLAKASQQLGAKEDYICPADPVAFYQAGAVALNSAKRTFNYHRETPMTTFIYNRKSVKLGPPVTKPNKIICVGTNYRDHVIEMNSNIPEYPVLFAKFANALIGPDDAIMKSLQTSQLDYEVELAVVIGDQATMVREEEALDVVAGYTIANDISARDLQKRTPQWLQGKTLDRSTPIGPWLVTADEIEDPGNLMIQSVVNGERRQFSNTNQLIFNIPYLVAFISNLMTLEPGDIILTGTPDGVGFAQQPPAFLRAGDQVELTIEGIGTLTNTVE